MVESTSVGKDRSGTRIASRAAEEKGGQWFESDCTLSVVTMSPLMARPLRVLTLAFHSVVDEVD